MGANRRRRKARSAAVAALGRPGSRSSPGDSQTPQWAAKFKRQSPQLLTLAAGIVAGLELDAPREHDPQYSGYIDLNRISIRQSVESWDPTVAFAALDIALGGSFLHSRQLAGNRPSSWAPYWAMRGTMDYLGFRHEKERAADQGPASLQLLSARMAAFHFLPAACRLFENIAGVVGTDPGLAVPAGHQPAITRAAKAAEYLASAGTAGRDNILVRDHPRLLCACVLEEMVGCCCSRISEQMLKEVCDELLVLITARQLVRTMLAPEDRQMPGRRLWHRYWNKHHAPCIMFLIDELCFLADSPASWALIPATCDALGSIAGSFDQLDGLLCSMVAGGLVWPQARASSRRLFCQGAPLWAEAYLSDNFEGCVEEFCRLLWTLAADFRNNPTEQESLDQANNAVYRVFQTAAFNGLSGQIAPQEVGSWGEWVAAVGGDVHDLHLERLEPLAEHQDTPADVVGQLVDQVAAIELEMGQVRHRETKARQDLTAAVREIWSLLLFHRIHVWETLVEAYKAWGLHQECGTGALTPEVMLERAASNSHRAIVPLQRFVQYFQENRLGNLVLPEGSEMREKVYENDYGTHCTGDMRCDLPALSVILLWFFDQPESGCDRSTASQILLYLEQDFRLPISSIQSLRRRLHDGTLERDSTLARVLMLLG